MNRLFPWLSPARRREREILKLRGRHGLPFRGYPRATFPGPQTPRLIQLGSWLLIGLVALGAGFDATAAVPGDPLGWLHPHEIDAIVRFQGDGKLALLMKAISKLGPGDGAGLMIAILLFAIQPRLALRAMFLLVVGLWLREILALVIQSPRPFWIDPRPATFGEVASTRQTYGMPSGHVMIGTSFWFFLAGEVRRPWAWTAAGLVALSIAVSRIYLGVHFFSDVMAGAVLGGLYLAAFRALEKPVGRRLDGYGRGQRVAAGLAVGILMALVGCGVAVWAGTRPVVPGWESFIQDARKVSSQASFGGLVSGTVVGAALLRTWAGSGGPWWLRVIRVGLAGAAVKGFATPVGNLLLKFVAAEGSDVSRAILVFLVSMGRAWIVWFLVPWLFIRIHLAIPDPKDPSPGQAGKGPCGG